MFNQSKVSCLKHFITLMIGIVIGFTFSQVMDTSRYEIPNIGTSSKNQDVWLEEEVIAEIDSTDVNGITDEYVTKSPDLNTTLADKLYDEVKILCWILTGPANHEKKAIHVKNTWGSRCNKLIFMSTKEDTELGAVKLPVGEGRGNLWNKTREAFKYIYEHHLDEYDWFLKADDDTLVTELILIRIQATSILAISYRYVIVENLRLFLYPMSAEAPVYFGCKFKPHVRQVS